MRMLVARLDYECDEGSTTAPWARMKFSALSGSVLFGIRFFLS